MIERHPSLKRVNPSFDHPFDGTLILLSAGAGPGCTLVNLAGTRLFYSVPPSLVYPGTVCVKQSKGMCQSNQKQCNGEVVSLVRTIGCRHRSLLAIMSQRSE
jgi:hypothetical protein